MAQIGKTRRRIKRPHPDEVPEQIPVAPVEKPIEVPNWPSPVKAPVAPAPVKTPA